MTQKIKHYRPLSDVENMVEGDLIDEEMIVAQKQRREHRWILIGVLVLTAGAVALTLSQRNDDLRDARKLECSWLVHAQSGAFDRTLGKNRIVSGTLPEHMVEGYDKGWRSNLTSTYWADRWVLCMGNQV